MTVITLAVMRLAEMHRQHPQQDDTRVCSVCGERVGIYPSGHAALKRDPTIRIVCSHCLETPALVVLAPGAEREAAESFSVPKGKDRQ